MGLRLFKHADDLSSRTAFEEAFANLAFAVQNDAIPRLAKHVLGFQLMEKSDDERRAVGIIGLQLGSILAYAPFFFRDGEMSGNELLWLVKSDTFVPKTEDWVDYLLGLGARSLGRPISLEDTRRSVGVPDLTAFRTLPIKTGSDVAHWAKPGFADFYAAASPEDPLYKGADLTKVVDEPALATSLVNLVQRHPRIGDYVRRFYGDGLLARASAAIKRANSVISLVRQPQQTYPSPLIKNGVRIYVDTEPDDGTLRPQERLELMKKGYYIKDYRKSFSKAAAYEQVINKLDQSFVTPTTTGIYKLLCNDGDMSPAIIIDGKYLIWPDDKPVYGTSYIRTSSGPPLLGQLVESDPEVIYRRGYTLNEAVNLALSRRNKNILNDSVELLVGDKYGTWVPIRILNPADKDAWELVSCGRAYTAARRGMVVADDNSLNVVWLKDRETDTDKITVTPTTIFLPKDVAAFPLGAFTDENPPVFIPQDPAKLQDVNAATKAASYPYRRLTLTTNDDQACINGHWMSKKAGLFHLIRDHGFSEHDAERLLRESYMKKKRYLVKYSQVIGTAPPMPYPPEPIPTVNPVFGEPALSDQVQVVRPGSANLSAPIVPYNAPLNPNMEPQLVAAVTQAARTGQKEVFDTSVLSAMLANTDAFDVVEKHIPKLLKGVDAIGRLLFNIYWHQDTFEDRVGRYDLAKLRDTLRSIFIQLGNAVVALKERASAADMRDISEALKQQQEQ